MNDTAPPAEKPGWKARLEALGTLGLVVHFSVFFACILGFAALISTGLHAQIPWVRDHAEIGSGATFVVAYGLTQALKPARILLTLAVTPVLARWRGQP